LQLYRWIKNTYKNKTDAIVKIVKQNTQIEKKTKHTHTRKHAKHANQKYQNINGLLRVSITGNCKPTSRAIKLVVENISSFGRNYDFAYFHTRKENEKNVDKRKISLRNNRMNI